MGYQPCAYCGGSGKEPPRVARVGALDTVVTDPCPFCGGMGGQWIQDAAPTYVSRPSRIARSRHELVLPRKSTTSVLQPGVLEYRGDHFLFMRHGKGVGTMAEGLVYDGSWFWGKWSGSGTLKKEGVWVCTGQFRNGALHGVGNIVRNDGSRFEGRFRHGKPSGQGQMVFSDGSYFDGKWIDFINAKGHYRAAGSTKVSALIENGTLSIRSGWFGTKKVIRTLGDLTSA